MAFDLNTPTNSIENPNKPNNGPFGKNDSHSPADPTAQVESPKEASTSSGSKQLGHLNSGSIRDTGDSQDHHHPDHINTLDPVIGVMPNHQLDPTLTSKELSPRSRIRNLRNHIDLNTSQEKTINSISNDNYNDTSPEETLTATSDYNNDTTLGETLHSTPNNTSQYNHLGARPKTNSYTNLNTPQRTFKETFRFKTNRSKKPKEFKNSNLGIHLHQKTFLFLPINHLLHPQCYLPIKMLPETVLKY